jgi:hypothetical protein
MRSRAFKGTRDATLVEHKGLKLMKVTFSAP